jgi:predicted RNA-binding Zn ribbon-like protein
MIVDVSNLPLVAGHPGLDLVNTVEPRVVGQEPERDHLADPAALLTWVRRAELADDAELAAVAEAWTRDPGSALAALDAVKDIRESLYATLLGVAGLVPSEAPGTRAALERLHTRWLAAVGRSMLRLDSGPGAAATPRLAVGLAPALLVPDRVADAAYQLLLTADLERLKRCPTEAGGCGWLFLDHSRNRSRRWCRMADCGTEVKARRLTERRRAGRTSTTPTQ